MYRRLIYILICILIAVLPFHNLILQVGINKLGLGQYLAMYKDVLQVGILILVGLDIWSASQDNTPSTALPPLCRGEGLFGKPKLTSLWKRGISKLNFNLKQKYLRQPAVDTSLKGGPHNNNFVSKSKISKDNSVIFIILAIIILNILAIINSFVLNKVTLGSFVFGYYFELWWVMLFGILAIWWYGLEKGRCDLDSEFSELGIPRQLRCHPFEKGELLNNNFSFQNSNLLGTKFFIKVSILSGYVGVLVFQILTWVIGQKAFLTLFGYGTGSQGLVNSTITCHPIDFGIDTCRAMSSFAHPLHLAGYLLMVIPFLIVWLINSQDWRSKVFYSVLVVLGSILIFATFTRFAWLGLGIIFLVVFLGWFHNKSNQFLELDPKLRHPELAVPILPQTSWLGTRYYSGSKKLVNKNCYNILTPKVFKSIITCSLIGVLVFVIGILSINPVETLRYLPQSIVKPSSTTWHYRHLGVATTIINRSGWQNMIGYGLGSIGSAARAKYQDINVNPIAVQYERVAYDWYFVKETFLVTENWFLQELINGGLVFAIIYFALILVPLKPIWDLLKASSITKKAFLRLIISLGFFGVFLGNNLEHLWESQTLAVYWSLLWIGSEVIS